MMQLDGLNYLAGYVMQNLLKKLWKKPDFKSTENQAVVSLLESAIEGDATNNFINTSNIGG